jgi:hypothetical protein
MRWQSVCLYFFCVATCKPLFTSVTDILFYSKAVNFFCPFFFTASLCNIFLLRLVAMIFLPLFFFFFAPFFRLPLAVGFGFMFFCVATYKPLSTSVTDILFYSKVVNFFCPFFSLAKQEQLYFYVVRLWRTHCIFLPLFLFLFFVPFFVCLWQSVCFICCDLQANIYKHYRHFILQQSCKYFAPFFSCKARVIKFLCCPPKSDTLHFFCPFFLFKFYSKALKDFILLVVWRCHSLIFLPLFFFCRAFGTPTFCPFFSFSFLPLFSSAFGSRFVFFIKVLKTVFLTSFLFFVVLVRFVFRVLFWLLLVLFFCL